MFNASYVSLANVVSLFNTLAVESNNISNLTTSGYKEVKIIHEEFDINKNNVEQKLSYGIDKATVIDHKDGAIDITNRQLDLALNGEGYFVVMTPLGERYRRSGKFQLNEEGTLVDENFYPVVGDDRQPITIQPEDVSDIHIDNGGMIYAAGQELQALAIVTFDDLNALELIGHGLYNSNTPPLISENFNLIQGALEKSNVSPIHGLTTLVNAQRGTELGVGFMNDIHNLSLHTIKTMVNISK
ncbi:MAG: flagellar hook-basal body complex protein [Rickettsiales endosymbiont of Dermacentor nuttalli]